MWLNAGCGEDLREGWCNVDVRVPEAVVEGEGWVRVSRDREVWRRQRFGSEGLVESRFMRVDLSGDWPGTLGGWLRGVPPIVAVFEKEGCG